jgi:Type I phosphodiesterase / nucleotide pyrophosphatase
MPQQLLLLELNEINFDYVAEYCDRGELPHFARLIEAHGVARTVSERRHEELEPWIQWVTAHTGLRLSEHGVFRLGDIVKHDLPQIWEALEAHGLRVGAISPMNAKNRLRDAAFFVPDPWTPTAAAAAPRLRALYQAIAQAVNENAKSRVTPESLRQLLAGFVAFARAANYAEYLRLVATSARRPWRRAMVLDLLLADVFVSETLRAAPDFASLFLNGAAHVQHHYLFASACYPGPHRNPDWYVPRGVDPVLEAYAIYDRILGQVREAFPSARLMIATGLHQDPHEEVTFYWRLRDHAKFLSRIRVPFVRVEPRMSRDFVVVCASAEQAAVAERRLARAVAADGSPLFDVDNRGEDLFVMLSYPREIGPQFEFGIEGEKYEGLDREVAFVALKNGEHNGLGYFLDTALARASSPRTDFPLAELPRRILDAFGLAAESAEPGRAVASSA